MNTNSQNYGIHEPGTGQTLNQVTTNPEKKMPECQRFSTATTRISEDPCLSGQLLRNLPFGLSWVSWSDGGTRLGFPRFGSKRKADPS